MIDQPKPTGERLPCGCTIEPDDAMKSSVFWNPFNNVVQCHKCGHIYEPKQYAKPKPTGEWTQEWLRQYLAGYSSYDLQLKAIADVHNAALAAARTAQARDDRKHWEARVYGLEQQLASEREKFNKELREYESALSDTHLSRIKVLEQQLAAERGKVRTYEDALIKIANDPNCDRCQVAVDALAKVAK